MINNIIYLELVHNNHHKFYELIQSDKKIIIKYGRIGRTGHLKIINFPSIPEAQDFFDKQIQVKTKKGYKKSIKGLTPPRIKGIHPGQLRIIWL